MYHSFSDVQQPRGGGGGGEGRMNRWMDKGVPFWLLNWYTKI